MRLLKNCMHKKYELKQQINTKKSENNAYSAVEIDIFLYRLQTRFRSIDANEKCRDTWTTTNRFMFATTHTHVLTNKN